LFLPDEVLLAVFGGAGEGAGDAALVALEFVQGALGYRTYEVYDMYANTLGVLIGWAAALTLPGVLPAAASQTP